MIVTLNILVILNILTAPSLKTKYVAVSLVAVTLTHSLAHNYHTLAHTPKVNKISCCPSVSTIELSIKFYA